ILRALHAEPAGSPTTRFEVATIRLNTACANGTREQHSPGRYGLRCAAIRDIIRVAYGSTGGPPQGQLPPVLGGPRWLDTDRYDIEATAPGNPGLDQMYGPMTRALLEERFRLKLRDEVRKMPVYNLTVKGTARMKPIQN